MRRELFIHFSFWFSFFVLVSIFKNYLALSYWPFWLGGAFGLFLPDLDHLIYALFLNPQELTSQRIGFLWNRKEIRRIIELLYETRNERKGLIFHTIFFQLIFFILTFWVFTSSASIFGKGLVLSFAIHLLIDQVIDLIEVKNLSNWMKYIPFEMDFQKSKIYFVFATLIVFIFGFLM